MAIKKLKENEIPCAECGNPMEAVLDLKLKEIFFYCKEKDCNGKAKVDFSMCDIKQTFEGE